MRQPAPFKSSIERDLVRSRFCEQMHQAGHTNTAIRIRKLRDEDFDMLAWLAMNDHNGKFLSEVLDGL